MSSITPHDYTPRLSSGRWPVVQSDVLNRAGGRAALRVDQSEQERRVAKDDQDLWHLREAAETRGRVSLGPAGASGAATRHG